MQVPEVKGLIFMKGYSERVPRKNMRKFCGRPLLHWIIDSLGQSKYITEIIVNTDSEEIAEEASKNPKVKIHMRPEYLLTINSNEANQLIEYDLNNSSGEYYLQTHSTNPLLKVSTIDKGIETYFQADNNDSLFSVTALRKRFYWSNGLPINHDPLKMIKTQELAPVFEENSCIYIFSKGSFFRKKSRVGMNPLLFPIDSIEAVDIDEESDFVIAESIQRNNS